MVGLFSLSSDSIDDALERATSEYLPHADEDLEASIEVSDMIKSKKFPIIEVIRSFKRRLFHRNPNVQLLTLKLTDFCIKNSGFHFSQGIASREFIDTLVNHLIKNDDANDQVEQSCLSYIQSWATVFKKDSDLCYMNEVYRQLKREGIEFPSQSSYFSNHSFPSTDIKWIKDTKIAPEWTDSDKCVRCKTSFSMTMRKHHCRMCGNCFCHACTDKEASLPEFGIIEQVRLCEGCWVIKQNQIKSLPSSISSPSNSSSNSPQSLIDPEDKDLIKAIELSKKENISTFKKTDATLPPSTPTDEDKDLEAAIKASLQDMEAREQKSFSNLQKSSFHPLPSLPTLNQENSFSPSSIEMVSSLQRENIHLFATLMKNLDMNSISTDPDVAKLASDMNSLNNSRLEKLDSDLYLILSEALNRYEEALQFRPSAPSIIPSFNLLQPISTRGDNTNIDSNIIDNSQSIINAFPHSSNNLIGNINSITDKNIIQREEVKGDPGNGKKTLLSNDKPLIDLDNF